MMTGTFTISQITTARGLGYGRALRDRLRFLLVTAPNNGTVIPRVSDFSCICITAS
jgi:hypothetical protein